MQILDYAKEEQKKQEDQKLWDKVINYFRKRSLWMLHYCTGCGAMELPPILTSRWDIERFGVGPMATPRQADILLLTGYVSTNTMKRVIRTYEQMPEPKWVLAFGSCTVNGGMYWDSYNTVNNVGEYIPIDITIAGCMPRPEAILDSMIELMDMIQRGEAKAFQKYKENYSYYKENQDRLFKRTKPVLESSALRYIHDENGGEQ
ncbi:NADH-quinone oxidoreductase subunit B [Helicovermis profundi]|uniref:NADH-quinone oxidoreductase subunit B n=1 Tax=Helicovermis profundi TaxID=3065157 RepID=A0AAU9EK39_9FIRM|nr:NADH-quinone oxidoreductase subunit B [Clostridia bacterium S502]